MNTNPEKQQNSDFLRWLIKDRRVQILGGLLSVLMVWFIISAFFTKGNQKGDSQSFFEVKRGPLMISVTEPGTIYNREKVVVKSKVEGKTNILSIVPEGTHVKKGAFLIQLDASGLEDQKMQQQITVLNAEAAFIHARENLSVAKSQADSDIAKAKLDYNFTQVDLNKYLQGEYPQELQQAKAEITVAREEFERARDKLEWSQRLNREGYITRNELQADELAAKRKELDVQLSESKLDLLQKYTHVRKLKELRSNLVQTKKALDRVKRKAVADTVQAEAELKAKESEYKRQQIKLQKLNDQITECKITAPVDGLVVYATTGDTKKYGKEPIEEGREVIQGMPLIHLPTSSSMMADVNIRESSLNKVKQGMPARIFVDALPGKVFSGRVKGIDLFPNSDYAWLNPDWKVYKSEIYIDGDAKGLRPGMTCRVEIIVEEYSDTLYIPVQSVVRVRDKHIVYVSRSNGPERREVKIGMDNDRMVRIVKGLSVGEKVLLAPPLAPSEVPLQEKLASKPKSKAKSSEKTSTKDKAIKSKTSVSQPEKSAEKSTVEKTTSNVSETLKIDDIKLPSLNPAPPSEPPKSRLHSQEGRAYYLVQRGDTLSKISARKDVYANPIKWPSLFRHNIDKLRQMDEVDNFEHRELPEGLKLKILTLREVSKNLKKLGQKRWVVNVTSEKKSKGVVPPAVTLLKRGYHAYLVRAKLKGEEWMRLRVGFFKKRSIAASEKKNLENYG